MAGVKGRRRAGSPGGEDDLEGARLALDDGELADGALLPPSIPPPGDRRTRGQADLESPVLPDLGVLGALVDVLRDRRPVLVGALDSLHGAALRPELQDPVHRRAVGPANETRDDGRPWKHEI